MEGLTVSYFHTTEVEILLAIYFFLCIIMDCLFFSQKVVEEDESQVKKSSAELFSPGSKQSEPDPVRKVS